MRIENWSAGGSYSQVTGRRIFLRQGGSGRPLVLIHGFPAGSWIWHRMWPRLAERWAVIAPDLLGFGLSDKPPEADYTIAQQADILDALLIQLGLREVDVLAHAYGVSVAQELLARRVHAGSGAGSGAVGQPPVAIRSMCFLNGAVFPEANRRTFGQRLTVSAIGPLVVRIAGLPYAPFRRNMLRVFGRETKPNEADLEAFWTLLRRNGGERVIWKLMTYLAQREANRERWVTAMERGTIPLHMILGPDDPLSGAQDRRWREVLPHHGVTVLTSPIGHFPQFEGPLQVARAYEGFRAGIGGDLDTTNRAMGRARARGERLHPVTGGGRR